MPQVTHKYTFVQRLVCILLTCVGYACFFVPYSVAYSRTPQSPPPDTIYIYDTVYEYIYIEEEVLEEAFIKHRNNIPNVEPTIPNNVIVDKPLIQTYETFVLDEPKKRLDKPQETKRVYRRKRKNPFLAEVYVCPAVPYKKMYLQTNEPTSLLAFKQEAETPMFKFTTGINTSCSYKKYSFHVGLAYSQYIEKTSYAIPHLLFDSTKMFNLISRGAWHTDTIWGNPYEENGEVKREYDLDSIWRTYNDTAFYMNYDTVRIGSFLIQNRNTFTYLDIPLSLSFHARKRGNIFYAKAGMVASLLLGVTGETLSDKDMTKLTNVNNIPFNRWHMNVLLALGTYQKLYNNTYGLVEICYTRSISPLISRQYVYNQLYSAIGLRFGFRFLLDVPQQ